MTRARLRLELPPDFPVADEDVRAALRRGLEEHCEGDDLCKAHGRTHASEVRQLPHRYPQARIALAGALYERQMRRMIQEIEDALLA